MIPILDTNGNELKLKNTKIHDNFRVAVKEQHLDINYFIDTAKSIVRELEKDFPHRSYLYEKINTLNKLKEY